MRECVKKLREEWKIKLAWVMICTILLQALAGWRVIPVMAGETEKMDLSGYATPSDAFQHFNMWTDRDTVSGNGFELQLELAFDNNFLETAVEDAQGDIEKCPDLSFQIKVECSGLNKNINFQNQELTYGDALIGTMVTEQNGTCLDISIIFNKEDIYSGYQNIESGAQLSLGLEAGHNGDEIELEDNQEGIVTVKLSSQGSGQPEDKGAYSLVKKADSGDGLDITYTITARASSSEASLAQKATPATASSGFEDIDDWETWQAMDEDEEDEEYQEEDGDGTTGSASQLKKRKSSRRKMAESSKTYTLGGKHIIDDVPSELVVTHAYAGTGDAKEELLPLEDYYDQENGRFVYPIAASASEADAGIITDSAGNIIEASVTIETEISSRLLENWNEQKNLELTIQNKATLRDGEDSQTSLAEADTTTKKTLGQELTKDGQEILSQGENKIRWKIKMKTLLHTLHSAYLIDWLGEGLEYADEITVKEGGAERTISFKASDSGIQLELGKQPPNNYFKKGGFLSGIEEELKDFKEGEAVRFSYSYQSPDGKIHNAQGFILPALDLVNKDVELVYYSKVPKTSVTEGQGTVTNNATLFHNHVTGEGIGPWDWPPENIDLEHRVDYNHNALKKTAGSYDETTQTMTWKFEINRSAAEISSFTMRDAFDPPKQVILDSNFPDGKLVLKKVNRDNPDSGDDEVKLMEGGHSGDYYTLEETEDGIRLLTIHLAQIEAQEYYSFEIRTRIVDPVSLSQDQGRVENTAEYELTSGSETIEGTAADSRLIPNAYVSKKAIDSYNYRDNLVKWQIGYNQNNILLNNSVLTDHLPVGTVFSTDPALKSGLTGVWKKTRQDSSAGTYREVSFEKAASGSELRRPASPANLTEAEEILRYKLDGTDDTILAVYSVTERTAQEKYADQDIFFVLYEKAEDGFYVPLIGEDAWQYEFTAYVEEKYRQEKFKTAEGLKLLNQAALDSDIISTRENEGMPVHITKDAQASHTAAVHMLKKGEFHPFNKEDTYDRLPWLKWELAVNITGVNFEGVKISDHMAGYLELEPASMRFYRITMAPDGSYDYSPDSGLTDTEIDENFTVVKNGGGFTIEYKESAPLARVPVLVVYDTVVVDSVPDSGADNTVLIEWPDGSSDSTVTTNAEAGRFQSSSFAKLEKLQMATVTKKSANSSDSGDGYTLQGAKFQLIPVFKLQGESPSNPGAWVQMNDPTAAKVRTSNENGQMFFLRLQSNTIYKLEETQAAPGYDSLSFKPQHILFGKGALDSLPKLPDGVEDTLQYQDTVSNGAKMYFDALNSPQDLESNRFRFYKTDKDGNGLKGAVFTLTAIQSSILTNRDSVSDENGKVDFAGLEPGIIYSITEKKPPYGYKKAAGSLTLEAEFDSVTGEFEINANAVNGFPYIPGDDAAGTEASVINEPILSNIAFYKTGQDFVPLNGNTYPVRFKVERKAAGEPEESFEDWSAGPDGSSMIPLTEDGLVRLDSLPCGVYRFTEDVSEVPEGLLAPEQKMQKILVEIEPASDGLNGSVTFYNCSDSSMDETMIKAEGVLKNGCFQPADTKILQVTNSLRFGYIQVNKVKAVRMDDKLTMTSEPAAGAGFSVYEAKVGTEAIWEPVDKDVPLLTLTTDGEGHFSREEMGDSLIAGRTYLIRESKVPSGYYKDTTLNYPGYEGPENKGFVPVTIGRAGETYYIGAVNKGTSDAYRADKTYDYGAAGLASGSDEKLLYYNIEAQTGNVKGEKLGAFYYDGAGITRTPLEGVTFELTELPVTEYSYRASAVTDQNGSFLFENIPAGSAGEGKEYELREITPAFGYETPDDTDKFVRTVAVKEYQTAEIDVTGEPLVFLNDPLTFEPKVNKKDPELAPLSGAEFLLEAEDGTVTEICYLKETAGGVHSIPDPSKESDQKYMKLSGSDIWKYFTYTGANGMGALTAGTETPKLYYSGSFEYRIREIKAPAGYMADGALYKVDRSAAVNSADGVCYISNSQDGKSFVNRYHEDILLLEKRIEAEDGGIVAGSSGADVSGFCFLLTGKDFNGRPVEEWLKVEDITGASEVKIVPSEGIYLETEKDGEIVIRSIKEGLYQAKEIEGSRTGKSGAYIADAGPQTVTVRRQKGRVTGGKFLFINYLKRGTITGKKVAAPVTDTSAGLSGALMGLFKEGTGNFTIDNTYLGNTALSGSGGEFRFEDIPYGTYIVAEITPPSGYYLNRTVSYRVVLSGASESEGTELIKNSSDGAVTAAEDESEIVIGDWRIESAGHGGGSRPGSGGNSRPTGPGLVETQPEIQKEPGILDEEAAEPPKEMPPSVIWPEDSENFPPATIKREPDGIIRVEIPDERITYVTVKNDRDELVFEGSYDKGFTITSELPAGEYRLITMDENGVPLGSYLFVIDEGGVPLASLPRMGEHSLPVSALPVIMAACILLIGYFRRRRG